jgi:eukaryotic-like serine/threonine-protein kinase
MFPFRPPPEGFELVRPLAGGPYFHVWLVTRGDVRHVAKRTSPRFADDPRGARMVENEAMALRLLEGRGAPALVASGDDAHGAYLVTEWVEGMSLLSFVHDACFFRGRARAIFAALTEIHARGLVHGDPSPTNILMTKDQDPTALFLDFGLSRRMVGEPLEGDGSFAGTLAYAAPEVASSGGRASSFASDVFAVAAVLLHHISGQAPRPELTTPALLVHAAEVPVDGTALEALCPGLGRAVSPEPERRPTAHALASELRGSGDLDPL